ncbi:MAG TPA: ATP-binding protein [Sporichthyaceae bacterium]|nr:ATP-binding protein [Sporichthyaceae bacterium]
MSTTHGQGQLTHAGRADGTAAWFFTCLDLGSGEVKLAEARDRLGIWLDRIGVGGEEFWEILTAAGEACANAFEHSGAAASGPGGAWIAGWLTAGQLNLVIGDHGTWREPDPLRSHGDRRGRGRLLMAHLMDTTVIRPGPDGTMVKLSKQLVSLPAATSAEPARPAMRRHAGRRAARATAT